MIERKEKVEVATFQKAKHNNNCSGDSFYYIEQEHFFLCALADGLGSGVDAKKSSDAVIEVVKRNIHDSLDVILEKCNEALIGNSKRGAVVGLLRIDYKHHSYSYASIGNVGIIASSNDRYKRNLPVTGYLPSIRRNFYVHEDTLLPQTTFLMFSDGINERGLKKKFNEWQSIKDTINYLQQMTSNDDATMIAMKYIG
ncbi:SpoIIE family protein phosphatase [Bacillaceae bacterium W0354]